MKKSSLKSQNFSLIRSLLHIWIKLDLARSLKYCYLDAKHIAADLLSQAEHDRMASAVLVTDSYELAEAVQSELERQIPELPRAEIARDSIDNNGKIIVVDSLMKAIDIANEIAPEHLEVCVDDPFRYLADIRHAGSIFLGRNAPEALGDYFAGPNHTLPTSGTARFSSPLGVDDFIKKSSYLYYTREALEKGINTRVLKKRSLFHVARNLKKYLKNKQFDILHCHGSKANVVSMLMGKASCPIISTIQVCELHTNHIGS